MASTTLAPSGWCGGSWGRKVGSNPQLRARTFSLSFKKPFQILADADLVSLRDTPFLSETVLRQKLLGDRDSNPNSLRQRQKSYR